MKQNAFARGFAAALLLAMGCSAKISGFSGPPIDGSTDPDVIVPPGVDMPPGVDAPPGVDIAAPDVTGVVDMPVTPPPSLTYDYVITQYSVDSATGGAAPNPVTSTQGATGFNLDGLYSSTTDAMVRGGAACGHVDFFSVIDPDQNMGTCSAGLSRGGSGCLGGVDNQLPEIANTVQGFGTDLRASLNDGVQSGRNVIIVRVSEVNGIPGPGLNDESVTVRVYPGAHPMFASCSMISAAGSMYAIDNAALATSGDVGSARYRFEARIVNGRLITAVPPGSAPNFVFSLPLMGAGVPLGLSRTQLRVDMTPDLARGGNLGGYAQLRELASMIAALLPAGIPPATVQTVLMSLVDVQDPSGDPSGCTAPNGGISIGMGFTAVRAVVVGSTVDGPVPGMCGSN